ncbi:WXG100 family type VII secretion target [Bounagaea algeriensis]
MGEDADVWGNAGGGINTFVEGDSGSCRETAAWLGTMSAGCHDIGTGIHRARSESESVWQGDAGEGFRDEMARNGADADELTEYFNRGKVALDTFADDLDTVRAKMRQAREVATQHGLNVTPTTIEHPGPEPAKMPSNGPGPDTTERTPGEEQAVADYQAKVRAFNEAHATCEKRGAKRIQRTTASRRR